MRQKEPAGGQEGGTRPPSRPQMGVDGALQPAHRAEGGCGQRIFDGTDAVRLYQETAVVSIRFWP